MFLKPRNIESHTMKSKLPKLERSLHELVTSKLVSKFNQKNECVFGNSTGMIEITAQSVNNECAKIAVFPFARVTPHLLVDLTGQFLPEW